MFGRVKRSTNTIYQRARRGGRGWAFGAKLCGSRTTVRITTKQAENVLEGEARATSGAEAERMRRSPRSEREPRRVGSNKRSEGVASVSKLTPERSAVTVIFF